MFKAILTERLFLKGQQQSKSGHWEESITSFDGALSLSPKYSGIYLQKALALSEQKKFDDAINTLKKAISLKPSNPVYYLFSGIIYYDYRQMDHALDNFEEALKLAPENSLAICFKYLILMIKDKDVDKAYPIIRKHVENTNAAFKSRLLFFCESFILQHKKDAMYLKETLFSQAHIKNITQNLSTKMTFSQKLTYYLNNFFILVNYFFSPIKKKAYQHCLTGEIMLKNGNLEFSETQYKNALSCFPGCDEAKYTLIDINIYKKDFFAAYNIIKDDKICDEISNILESDELNNDDKNKLINHMPLISTLGLLHFYMDNYEVATQHLNFITNCSDDYYHSYYSGLCHLATNDNEQALLYFRKSMEKINPNVAQLRFDEMYRLFKKNLT